MSLPVPIEFRLPSGWKAISPDEAGTPGSAFVAVHPATDEPRFTTNITIDGERRPDVTELTAVADESIERLHQVSASVSLSQRTMFGPEDSPGLTQVLRVTTSGANGRLELVQCQVYLLMSDVIRSTDRAVIRLALTATEQNFNSVVADFQEFVGSVRPENSEQSDA